jgi:hypothetical protein
MRRPAGQRRIPKPVRRQRSQEPFLILHLSLLQNPGWRILNLSARRVLDRLVIEHLNHGGQNNGKLPVTYQIKQALTDLTALGFIKITRPGRSGNADFRQPTLYELTICHTISELSGQQVPATHAWRRVATLDDAKLRLQNARTPNQPHPKSHPTTSQGPTSKPSVHDTVRNEQHSHGSKPPRRHLNGSGQGHITARLRPHQPPGRPPHGRL